MANEAACSYACREFPEAESLVPRGGKSVSTVRGDNLDSFLAKYRGKSHD